jgi:hypothetical protein
MESVLLFLMMPFYFVENRGQVEQSVAYYAQGREASVYFSSGGLTYSLGGNGQRWNLRLEFIGANDRVRPQGLDRAEAVINIFKGPEANWRVGLFTYHTVVYRDLWPGIDLVFSGETDRLKYSFLVRPGADPAQIRLAYRGASDLRINREGQLEAITPLRALRDDSPVSYQEAGGKRLAIATSFRLLDAVAAGRHEFGFSLGEYDRNRTLVIDPAVFIYTSLIGGSGEERGQAIAVDNQKYAYLTGSTSSTEASFPVRVGPITTARGGTDAFVVKVKPDGSGLVYASFIGGAGNDEGFGIAVDQQGGAYVVGLTNSNASSFPVRVGPRLVYGGGAFDGFIVKVRNDFSGLDYAGYIGGNADDQAFGVAVDNQRNAHVTGVTSSTPGSFPVAVGPRLIFGGGTDAFIAKVRSNGSGFVYAGYLGGARDDEGLGVALDQNGRAYLTGLTNSSEESFPVLRGPGLIYRGDTDAFVARVRDDGSGYEYVGYIGGAGADQGLGIAVESSGQAFVTGFTTSDQATFPVRGGPSVTFKGVIDAFVASVNKDGDTLEYAGYIGGDGEDTGLGVAVDSKGEPYVIGVTTSSSAGFGAVGGPSASFGGLVDAFIAKIAKKGDSFEYLGYIGGSGDDQGFGIALDQSGDAYVTGQTASPAATFPAMSGEILNGATDAFMVKISTQGSKVSVPVNGKILGIAVNQGSEGRRQ